LNKYHLGPLHTYLELFAIVHIVDRVARAAPQIGERIRRGEPKTLRGALRLMIGEEEKEEKEERRRRKRVMGASNDDQIEEG
jgi:hypothetical protein